MDKTNILIPPSVNIQINNKILDKCLNRGLYFFSSTINEADGFVTDYILRSIYLVMLQIQSTE